MPDNNTSRVEEITAILRTEILCGQYRPGERLPSERDLSARFEVNRGAVRESLKKLEQLGIADIKPGGVRVVPVEDATLEVLGHIMDLEELPSPQLIHQLFEVFGALMSMSVRTAIEKADAEQITAMREIVSRLINSEHRTEDQHDNWKQLSDHLSTVNNNLVLRLIGNGLKTQFMGRLEHIGVLVKLENSSSDKNILQTLDASMADLDAAMEARDGEKAAEAVLAHFDLLRSSLFNALSQPGDSVARRFLHA